ncbi:MAG: TonB-dependent receptor plug domain-containing protein [Bacteroidales bacterium]|nr:TonB-dependent receptor plug domain-containing protein [Bacteroidales bacterium]
MKHSIVSILSAGMAALLLPSALRADTVKDSLGFASRVSSSPATLLEGRVSGVRVSSASGDPAAALTTLVRGVNSFRTDNQPLWVVDGVILSPGSNFATEPMSAYGESSRVNPFNDLAFLNPYDIESIEVLKDASATALYGSKGANGVILVKTRKGGKEGNSLKADASMGATTGGIIASAALSASAVKGPSALDVSAAFRSFPSAINGYGSNYGTIRSSYQTKANSAIWFGMNTILSMGKASQPSSTVWFGQPSLSMSLLAPDHYPALDSAQGWRDDYDDDAEEMRVVNSTWFTVNFTKSLSLKTSVGLDYRSLTRYIWHGNGTSFGNAQNGAASIASASTLRYNASSILSFKRFFSDHRISLSAGALLSGDYDKFNTMDGTDFLSHFLRAKGLNLHGDKTVLHQKDYSYFTASALATGSYSFKNLAGLDFSVRSDWTPRYSDDKPLLYGSVTAYVQPVGGLRLSAGYGVSGYEHYMPYTEGISPDLQMFYEGLGRLRTSEWNASADYSNRRMKLHAGIFSRSTTDSFNAYCFGKKSSTYLWYWSERQDVDSYSSAISAAGAEIGASLDVIKGKTFNWNLWANLSFQRNVVTSVAEQDRLCASAGAGLVPCVNIYGYPAASFVGYVTDESGSPKDISLDGKITEADMKVLGNSSPELYGAFGSTLSFGPLSLDIVADWAAGYKYADLTALWLDSGITSPLTDKYLVNADKLNLRRVSASYDFPKLRVELTAFSTYGADSAVRYGTLSSVWGAVAGLTYRF